MTDPMRPVPAGVAPPPVRARRPRRSELRRRAEAEFVAFVHERYEVLARFGWLLTGDRWQGAELARTVLARASHRWETLRISGAEHQIRKEMLGLYLSGWWREPLASVFGRLTGRLSDSAGENAQARVDDLAGPDSDPTWLALRGLNRRQRAVLVLRYAERLPDDVIRWIVGYDQRRLDRDRSAALAAVAAAGDAVRPAGGPPVAGAAAVEVRSGVKRADEA